MVRHLARGTLAVLCVGLVACLGHGEASCSLGGIQVAEASAPSGSRIHFTLPYDLNCNDETGIASDDDAVIPATATELHFQIASYVDPYVGQARDGTPPLNPVVSPGPVVVGEWLTVAYDGRHAEADPRRELSAQGTLPPGLAPGTYQIVLKEYPRILSGPFTVG